MNSNYLDMMQPPAVTVDALSRPDTPTELNTRQGRRNHSLSGVQLLDADGALSAKLEVCLGHIFAKYLDPPFEALFSSGNIMVLKLLSGLQRLIY